MSISSAFYAKLSGVLITKVQKRQSSRQSFYAFGIWGSVCMKKRSRDSVYVERESGKERERESRKR